MIMLPEWLMHKIVEDMRCPSCSGKMNVEFVTSVGIKESERLNNAKVCFIEYSCLFCNRKSHIEIKRYTMPELARDIMKAVENAAEKEVAPKKERPTTRKRKSSKTGIGKEEVDDAKKVIHDSACWNDMMIGLGMTQKEIDNIIEIGKKIDREGKGKS